MILLSREILIVRKKRRKSFEVLSITRYQPMKMFSSKCVQLTKILGAFGNKQRQRTHYAIMCTNVSFPKLFEM